jgi:hypothetical protein
MNRSVPYVSEIIVGVMLTFSIVMAQVPIKQKEIKEIPKVQMPDLVITGFEVTQPVTP